MKAKMLCLVVIALVGLSAFSQAEAITAERVIENMIVSYERQMKGVEDFTIISEMGISRTISYHKRAVIRGRVVYKTREETEAMGKKFVSVTVWDGVYYWWGDPVSGELEKRKMDISPYVMFESLKTAQVKYAGTEKIDGHKTHILNVRDLEIIRAVGMGKASGKLWVDARDWVIRKMKMDMEWEVEGEKMPIGFASRMEDFRRVNGMLIPYRTVMLMGDAIEMSPEEEEEEQEIRKKLAEIQRELEQMPPEERKMMEEMMRPQIEGMEKTLAGGGEVTIVKDVKVNTGLSDELFDGSKLGRR